MLTPGTRITGDMRHLLPTIAPFSFAQTLAFIRRFPPCQGEYLVADDAVTAAVMLGAEPVAFTIHGGPELTVEIHGRAAVPQVIARAAHWIGANDDLSELYAAAADDPPFQRLVDRLHGLHHVRFLTLEEIAVYCVMMQRTPVATASRMKRAFLDRFGTRVVIAGHELRAMPTFDELVRLEPEAIAVAIKHPAKAKSIATVVRGVAELGEQFLRTAPYAVARDALLAIPGVGPFSAGAILLRGLGRMDELPAMTWFTDEARDIYGASYDEAAILRRYGRNIGYWSYYLKVEASLRPRVPRGVRASSHDERRNSRVR